ncbi:hypothetical protein TNCV_4007841 [Trichonephila clavipes]|nr:hypothetical protein TNCV_4007841 [Trichonephila clavipes]
MASVSSHTPRRARERNHSFTSFREGQQTISDLHDNICPRVSRKNEATLKNPLENFVEETRNGADLVAVRHQESLVLDARLGAALALEEGPVGALALGAIVDAHPSSTAAGAILHSLQESDEEQQKDSTTLHSGERIRHIQNKLK